MHEIDDLLTVCQLKDYVPNTKERYPFGFIDRGRGGMTFLNTGQPCEFLAIVEFDPAKGPRGRHKHLTKQESFYVMTGTLKGYYWIDDEAHCKEYIHPAGTLITIQPGLFHTLECIDGPASALEFSPYAFDINDHVYP